MGKILNKFNDLKDKNFLYIMTGKKAKFRCDGCHRFTLYIKDEKTGKKECYWCKMKSLRGKHND